LKKSTKFGENVPETLKKPRSTPGFKNASSFLGSLTQTSFEKKGFAQSKLITNWNEIVGWSLSNKTKPSKITFPKNGLAASLVVEIDSAFGPEIELQREIIKEKVNRFYGYTAVAKIIFKPSPSIGYASKTKVEAFKDKTDVTTKVIKNSYPVSLALQKLILNLEAIKSEELRKSLHNLSNGFLKRSSKKSL
jgi:hypothetical protein